jgi:hypothetical protein
MEQTDMKTPLFLTLLKNGVLQLKYQITSAVDTLSLNNPGPNWSSFEQISCGFVWESNFQWHLLIPKNYVVVEDPEPFSS